MGNPAAHRCLHGQGRQGHGGRHEGRLHVHGRPVGRGDHGVDDIHDVHRRRDAAQPGKSTVNVLNATPRSGLAKQTADKLKKRGFRIGDVGNATATYDKKVNGAGICSAPRAAQAALPVLGTQLSGAEVKTDGRAQADRVDLIIGTAFKSLTKKEDADKALATLSGPRPAASASAKSC